MPCFSTQHHHLVQRSHLHYAKNLICIPALLSGTAKYKDFDLNLDVKTIKQLRTPEPNDWENAWIMWNRPQADDDFHYYAYTLLANGGGQLEKKDNDNQDVAGEIFLAYPDSPSIKPNTWQNWRIMVTGTATGTPNIQIWIDGVQALNYIDNVSFYASQQCHDVKGRFNRTIL